MSTIAFYQDDRRTPIEHRGGRDFNRPFRAPHHTVSLMGLLAELAIAAGGVLYLDCVDEFRMTTLRPMLRTWAMMHPSVRPLIVAVGARETAYPLHVVQACIEALGLISDGGWRADA